MENFQTQTGTGSPYVNTGQIMVRDFDKEAETTFILERATFVLRKISFTYIEISKKI